MRGETRYSLHNAVLDISKRQCKSSPHMTVTKDFDPNAAAAPGSGIFGLPYTEKESRLILLPVPWEATTSYRGGTSLGPSAILKASHQVDLFDLEVERPYQAGIHMRAESPDIQTLNEKAKAEAQKIIQAGGNSDKNPSLYRSLEKVNAWGEQLNHWVYSQSKQILDSGKLLGVVGGDHSVPLGAFQAIAERHSNFGILHFDAHSDTRCAYEGFTFSHASIMYNALERIPQITKLVQVGIRDVCEEEISYLQSRKGRVEVFFDRDLSARKFEGVFWGQIAGEIVSRLPNEVWVSFDIDGLDPRYCPNTGTPVPGGLDFQEACYLLAVLAKSGRKIIGFDLNEVAPGADNDWDANVGARVLYKLAAWTLR